MKIGTGVVSLPNGLPDMMFLNSLQFTVIGHNGQNGQRAISHAILGCIEDGVFVQIQPHYMTAAIVLESQKTINPAT